MQPTLTPAPMLAGTVILLGPTASAARDATGSSAPTDSPPREVRVPLPQCSGQLGRLIGRGGRNVGRLQAQAQSIIDSVKQVRGKAGLFDVSHDVLAGRLDVSGDEKVL